MNGTFYEQLGGVAGIFEQWGACERTVVACALARRVPWPGLKLVQRAVEAALQNHVDDERLERDANDETLLANLLAARVEEDGDEGCDRIQQLLNLLPLLHIGNDRAKDIYVSAAPSLVQRCIDSSRKSSPVLELCRQLLSYLLVHPALTHQDQRTLTQWLRYLESHLTDNRNTDSMWQQRIDNCLMPDSNIWISTNTFRRTIGKNVEFRGILDPIDSTFTPDLQESFSKNGRDVDISLDGEKLNFDAIIAQPKSQRSNSLTPPTTNFMHMSSSAENLSDEPFVQKPRSFSLSSEHSLSQLRPIGVMFGITGSETRLDDLRSNNFAEHPGMSTVAQWLKSLRLHKYVWLFSNISYEQMMSIDEEYLEKLGVTKGARHKLLISIKKLNDRKSVLEGIQNELTCSPQTTPGCTRALERLRGVLLGPMPPGSDIPQGVVATLELASKSLSSCPWPLPTRCTNSPPEGATSDNTGEAGPQPHPVSLHCWLVEKALHHESFQQPSLTEALRRLRHRLPPRQFYRHLSLAPHLPRAHNKHRWRPTPQNGQQRAFQKRWQVPAAPPPPRGKSHSYPPGNPPAHPTPLISRRLPSTSDDYSSLDALCLQMTEQAIN